MHNNKLEANRALLSSKPRPTSIAERHQRIDEVGSVWSVAEDVILLTDDLGGCGRGNPFGAPVSSHSR